MQDYFGLHRPENTNAHPVENDYTGGTAQKYVDDTTRCALNEGEPFPGFLVKRRVGHVTLYIGTHPIHGVGVFADIPASHPDGKIEVVLRGASESILLARSEYFGQLIEHVIPEHVIEKLCHDYRRFHISLEGLQR